MPDKPETQAQEPKPPLSNADVWRWMLANTDELLRDPQRHGVVAMTLDPRLVDTFAAAQLADVDEQKQSAAHLIALLMRGAALADWTKRPGNASVRDVRIKLLRGCCTLAHLYARLSVTLATMSPIDFAEGLDDEH